MNEKWTKENVIEGIKNLQDSHDKNYKSLVSAGARLFGTWSEAYAAAGTEILRKRNAGKFCKEKPADTKIYAPQSSICWTCARSAAPIGIRCSWDENKVLPEGAEYVAKLVHASKKEQYTVTVISRCPMYIKQGSNKSLEREKRRLRKKVNNTANYGSLCNAIASGVIREYSKAIVTNGPKAKKLDKYLLSDEFYSITGVNGQYIIDRVRKMQGSPKRARMALKSFEICKRYKYPKTRSESLKSKARGLTSENNCA